MENRKTIKFYIALWLAKFSTKILKLLKRNATSFPGDLAIKICPNFLGILEKPKTIIGITGTNGKTTVSNMINDILTENGYDFVNNKYGSNIDRGITTTLINASDMHGRTKKELAVLEIDERSANKVYPYLTPKYLICTNIFRDSLMRNAHTEFIADILTKYIPKETIMIENADDIICSHIAENNKRIFFGIDRLDTDTTYFENITYEDTKGSRSSDSIKKIAAATGAQIAIIGKANASFFTTIQGTAMKSYRSDVAITAINISDYSTIARATHQAGGVGGSDRDAHSIALVKSADYVSDDFVNQIVNKWQNEVQNGTEYTIYVNGLDFNDSIGFEEALKKNIGNLKSVYNRGVSGESSRYVVTYVGSSRDLAVDINAKAKNMGYQIIINSFDDKTITLKAAKR